MAPLIILLTVFLSLYVINRHLLNQKFPVDLMGRVALSVMLVFTGSAHFYKTEEMIQMLPGFLPEKQGIVFLTGILELMAAAGLLIRKTSRLTSIMLVLFFLSVLPANIIGSIERVELGGMENGPAYLYFRIPLQLFFIAWVYYFGIWVWTVNNQLTKT